MPFTPFHLGPALLLALLCYRWFDLPTVLAASVAVDARAALVYFGLLDPPLHGPLHTFLGATAVALSLAGTWYLVRPRFVPVLSAFRLRRTRSFAAVLAAAIVGVWLHVLLDATLYADVRPFAPASDANPFLWPLGAATPTVVYLGCVAAGVLGTALYAISVIDTDRGVRLETGDQPVNESVD